MFTFEQDDDDVYHPENGEDIPPFPLSPHSGDHSHASSSPAIFIRLTSLRQWLQSRLLLPSPRLLSKLLSSLSLSKTIVLADLSSHEPPIIETKRSLDFQRVKGLLDGDVGLPAPISDRCRRSLVRLRSVYETNPFGSGSNEIASSASCVVLAENISILCRLSEQFDERTGKTSQLQTVKTGDRLAQEVRSMKDQVRAAERRLAEVERSFLELARKFGIEMKLQEQEIESDDQFAVCIGEVVEMELQRVREEFLRCLTANRSAVEEILALYEKVANDSCCCETVKSVIEDSEFGVQEEYVLLNELMELEAFANQRSLEVSKDSTKAFIPLLRDLITPLNKAEEWRLFRLSQRYASRVVSSFATLRKKKIRMQAIVAGLKEKQRGREQELDEFRNSEKRLYQEILEMKSIIEKEVSELLQGKPIQISLEES